MAYWVRFTQADAIQFGQLEDDTIRIYAGDMFGNHAPTGARVPRAEVELLMPCVPGKLLGLWNNFYERAAKEGLEHPPHPLYFVKTNNCYLAPGAAIRQPPCYDGPVVFEGELGVVIGRTCSNVSEADADQFIFGYTCVNDVTARTVLKADASFTQWVRAKSYDTFGPLGPVIATDIEPDNLVVRSRVNGVEKQSYPVADMIYRPRQIVSRISQDMTLHAGDIIACGTSVGTEAMPRNCLVEIDIDGICVLQNRYE